MPSPTHDFIFDVNFAFGDESVFTETDDELAPPFPPVIGFFLYLTGAPFTLLNGQNLALL